MLVKLAAASFCVAVAIAPARASVGQVRYPVLGKDSALGAPSTRPCDDDSTARFQTETTARSAATTLRHVLLYCGWFIDVAGFASLFVSGVRCPT